MSRGMGWVQMACLWRIRKDEESGDWPTTYDIAAYVYQIKPDADGITWITDSSTSPLSARSKACSARD